MTDNLIMQIATENRKLSIVAILFLFQRVKSVDHCFKINLPQPKYGWYRFKNIGLKSKSLFIAFLKQRYD